VPAVPRGASTRADTSESGLCPPVVARNRLLTPPPSETLMLDFQHIRDATLSAACALQGPQLRTRGGIARLCRRKVINSHYDSRVWARAPNEMAGSPAGRSELCCNAPGCCVHAPGIAASTTSG